MFDIDIDYPVEDSYPPGELRSIADLQKQGFEEDDLAVVMRNKTNGVLYILLTDNITGRRWYPLRVDE